jgi:two-component system, NtrC family, nitrogen regulation sensor histidine kinase NtrY
MTSDKYQWKILARVLLLLCTLSAAAWCIVNRQFTYLMVPLPIIILQVIDFFKFHKKAQDEVSQFAEAIHYRDFSRHFDVKHAPTELQPLRQGFNTINSTFKLISREKEMQYVYLQKILELVDTGILSYQNESGEIVWMNEGFKKLLGIPYLKTIHSLEKRDHTLYQEVMAIKNGESRVVKISTDKSSLQILLSATAFQTEEKTFKLIAFQNINEALDETEAKAWQKLLSVMTHEIMNSIAPISSLADTLKNRLQNFVQHNAEAANQKEDLELGIETIKRRSEGLLKFAETYRNLNKITAPNIKTVYVRDVFENLHTLMQPTLQQKNIELEIILKDPGLMLAADTNLTEQVLINLLVNAIEAVKDTEEPRIQLAATTTAGRVQIKIADNGAGIPQELVEKIFIPFFSTKKSGSGIGLSLCKQIMLLHKGSINVQSTLGQGAVFTLQF